MVLIYLYKTIIRKLDNQDTGYWMLDNGLTRYSVDFIKRRAYRVFLQQAAANIGHPVSSNLVDYWCSVFSK